MGGAFGLPEQLHCARLRGLGLLLGTDGFVDAVWTKMARENAAAEELWHKSVRWVVIELYENT